MQEANKPTTYSFDKVFDPSASQANVFGEVSQLVESALDGYNVCIFAYGQTGAGKQLGLEFRHWLFYTNLRLKQLVLY